jgi:hypothetical protein
VTHAFALDAAWKTADLAAFFVQDDDNRSILQSGSTRPQPTIRPLLGEGRPRRRTSADHNYQTSVVFNGGTAADVIHVTTTCRLLPGCGCVFTDGPQRSPLISAWRR